MSKILNQKNYKQSILLMKSDERILEILHVPNKPSILKRTQSSCSACCISCVTPYCMKYLPEEITPQSKYFNAFPVDVNDNVCPTSAISWDKESLTPSINEKLCINCGLCASRCPAGAIYLTSKCAVVNFDINLVEKVDFTEETYSLHINQIQNLLKAKHIGQMLKESEKQMATIYQKIASINTDAQFPNLFTRNLLIQTGNRCFIRRRGDVYLRMDVIMELSDSVAIVEVEFNKDSLESPRAILDDIAVLVSRYGINIKLIKPFIVCLEFPNIRTEYWRVIKDIANVLKININSLSIGVLILFVWNFKKINFSQIPFYADIDKASIKQEVQTAIGFDLNLTSENCAILEPKK